MVKSMTATRTADGLGHDEHAAGLRFLCAVTALVALLGLGLAAGSLLGSLGPSAELLVTRTVDLSDIPLGGRRTVYWKGYSIFIAHRTPEEIALARADEQTAIWSKLHDHKRVQRDDWLGSMAAKNNLTFNGDRSI